MAGEITIHTDGSCNNNPSAAKSGGWAFTAEHKGKIAIRWGWAEHTTSSAMELMAALYALRFIPEGTTPIILITDSQYLKNAMTEWRLGWARQGWKSATGRPLKNSAIMWDLHVIAEGHLKTRRLEFRWVKGHAGHDGNEKVDGLAGRARTEKSTNWTSKDHRFRVGNLHDLAKSENMIKVIQQDNEGIKRADTTPTRRLTCCCCGNETRGRQWWNRDTGYGLCVECIDANGVSNVPMGRVADSFGVRGVHWGLTVEPIAVHPDWVRVKAGYDVLDEAGKAAFDAALNREGGEA